MRDINPLEVWLPDEDLSTPEFQRRAEAWLVAVEREVDQPKPKYPYGGFSRFPVKLPPSVRKRAEALFPRVWRGAGTGKLEVELSLLWLVGTNADAASIPFWKETVSLSRVRDRVAAQRREIAAAALAHTAVRHPGSGGFEALVALTEDEHVDARVAAVDALVHLAENEEWVGPLAGKAAEILRRVARDARAFAPRFLARRYLSLHGEPLPAYEHGDVIAFEVCFGKCSRTIELLADQTLVDLHFAILDAFGWDTDHLYQFALNGDLRDERFVIPALGDDAAFFALFEDAEEPSEPSIPLGALALPVGHEITYLYDFGDNNVFRIKVAGVHPKTSRAKYPRVTAKVGRSPEQYPAW